MRRILIVALAGACGGTIASSNDAGRDADATPPWVDAGYTDCTTPSGYRICGGANRCSSNGECTLCEPFASEKVISACYDAGLDSRGGACDTCLDGTVCESFPFNQLPALRGTCIAEELVPLFVKYGQQDRLFYSDRSRYTGAPLPKPATCPDIPGLPLCGGPCAAACPKGTRCSGRSPLHPFSLCMDWDGDGAWQLCSRSQRLCGGPGPESKCLIFKVSLTDQAIADANGICIETSVCLAAAKSYPGGAECL